MMLRSLIMWAALVALGTRPAWAQTHVGRVDLHGLFDTLSVMLSTQDIRFRIRNGSELNVEVANWLPPERPTGSRLAAARRIGVVVRDRYTGFATLSLLTVSFSGKDSTGARVNFVAPFRPTQLAPGDTTQVMTFQSSTRSQ